MSHKTGRFQKMYVQDNQDRRIHPLDCVPENRSKGSWTNGVGAWERATGSDDEKLVGWFFPPRIRNKGHHRWSTSKKKFVPRR